MMKKRYAQAASVLLAIFLFTLLPFSAYSAPKILLNNKWIETESSNIRPQFGNLILPLHNLRLQTNIPEIAKKFLRRHDNLLSFRLGSNYQTQYTIKNKMLNTVRFKRTHLGIEVLGAETLVHLKDQKVEFAAANSTELLGISLKPSLSAEEAENIALASYANTAKAANKAALKLLVHPKFANGEEARLSFKVNVLDQNGIGKETYYLDAHTGEQLLASTNIHTAMHRHVMSGEGTDNDFAKFQEMVDPSNSNPPEPMDQYATIFHEEHCSLDNRETCTRNMPQQLLANAVHAWDNMKHVHEYFMTQHGRDSFDDQGKTMKSVINFGNNFGNAAWVDGLDMMIYGNGDGVEVRDFVEVLDIAAHEMTHGITAKTAKLLYESESGALNESYSDVFGKLVSIGVEGQTDWKIGAKLFLDGTSAIRDMKNAEVKHISEFKHRNEFCSMFNDYCGVHSNSGIPNFVAVNIAEKIGTEKLGKIYYLTLTQLLRPFSNFADARKQTIKSCALLYGTETSQECVVVKDAFRLAGIN